MLQQSNPVEIEQIRLSVVICTRDRAEGLLSTVASVLDDAPSLGSFELLLVDQSDSDETARAVSTTFAHDRRVRYWREPSRGLSAARNAGIRAARGDIIAFTDDDCLVKRGWMDAIIATFVAQPHVGLLYGDVASAPHDASQGFLPTFSASTGPLTRVRMLAGAGYWGMGANMALRRTTWVQIGHFDEMLGAGTPLKSGEDSDYALRACRQGIAIYHCATAGVVHHGYRPNAVASGLVTGAAYAMGAVYIRHLRGGSLFAGVLLLTDAATRTWHILLRCLQLKRPQGLNALRALVHGAAHGLLLPAVGRTKPRAVAAYT